MKCAQFKRKLAKAGCIFDARKGKGSHQRVENPKNGRRSCLPMHNAELKKPLMLKILKDLGIKEQEL